MVHVPINESCIKITPSQKTGYFNYMHIMSSMRICRCIVVKYTSVYHIHISPTNATYPTGNFQNSTQGSNAKNGIFMKENLFSINIWEVCRNLCKLAYGLKRHRVRKYRPILLCPAYLVFINECPDLVRRFFRGSFFNPQCKAAA